MKLALERAMVRITHWRVFVGALAALHAEALKGQDAGPPSPNAVRSIPAPVFSIGQPPIWRQQLTAQGTAYSQGGRSGATFSYGVFHSFNKPPIQAFNPLLGLIGGTA